MEVEYSLALDDLLAFTAYLNTPSGAARRRQLAALLMYAGLTFVLLFTSFTIALKKGLGVAIGGSLAVVLAVAVFGLFSRPLLRRRTQRSLATMYTEGHMPELLARRRLTITPETVTSATETSVTSTKWAAVERIVIDQQHAYFCLGAASALILPKAAFATEADFNEFVEAAHGYHRDALGQRRP